MNVLLIDDHFCAREGAACLLKQIFPDLKIYEADSVNAGLAIARAEPLHLVLLDLQLPEINGLSGLSALKAEFPDLCVVMFSGADDREQVFEALRLGAMGFISKSMSRQMFSEALRDVLSGKVYLPASVSKCQLGVPLADKPTGMHPTSRPNDFGLTPREFEVLGWLVQGMSNKQIARQLQIEEQTVRNHLRPIFQKFGVTRRMELMLKAFEQGIVFGTPVIGNR
jgi:two-component system nitrate/nitrite response regulator NarL